MQPLKQILVAVDFSPASKLALEHAAALAQCDHAVVDILHVWELPALVREDEVSEAAGLPLSVTNAVSDYAQTNLNQFTDEARKNGIAIRSARTIPGKPYRAIVLEAERGHYDLIVVGMHGRSSLARALLGSVAELVVRHAHCPVLVARPLTKPDAEVRAAE